MTEASIHELNWRVIKHEATTPFFGHDDDGMCCLRARLTPDPEYREECKP